MRKRIKINKKKVAFILAATTLVTSGFAGWQAKGKSVVYAQEPEFTYFAEGFGTGVDFAEGNNSWNINTNFNRNVPISIQTDSGNKAAIVTNNHSDKGEPVIRLINGVQNANLSSTDSDYRSGTAISSNKISLDDKGVFSSKFTISMPDACVNTAQTGGEAYAREVGGDGISFIITSSDNIVGQAGGGIGYNGIDDSIVVELDSYFNGAYCTFETSDTALQFSL